MEEQYNDDGSAHCTSSVILTDVDISEAEGYEPEENYTQASTESLNKDKNCQVLKEKSPIRSRAPSLPLLISPEELTTSPGIMDEHLPEMPWSQTSSASSPPPAEMNGESRPPQTETTHSAVSKIPVRLTVIKQTQSSTQDTRLSPPSLPESSCPEREEKTREKRKKTALFSSGIPNTLRPDLSKVEPRVRFPKDGYTPPKSRRPLRSGSLSPEPRLVYMSPADIVTTVLFGASEEPQPEEEEELTPDVLSILPPDFRTRQQAIALMNELQVLTASHTHTHTHTQ
ncbi:hypothetical protein WMY93_021990 [Mugilogobius chulae]|uniref:Uncharacterized protein n=1 Tax=Mugilogobius chulae TaxID=88201 RepID=A0AAW0NFD2_9GOBI